MYEDITNEIFSLHKDELTKLRDLLAYICKCGFPQGFDEDTARLLLETSTMRLHIQDGEGLSFEFIQGELRPIKIDRNNVERR